jgi:hypothetical protein
MYMYIDMNSLHVSTAGYQYADIPTTFKAHAHFMMKITWKKKKEKVRLYVVESFNQSPYCHYTGHSRDVSVPLYRHYTGHSRDVSVPLENYIVHTTAHPPARPSLCTARVSRGIPTFHSLILFGKILGPGLLKNLWLRSNLILLITF